MSRATTMLWLTSESPPRNLRSGTAQLGFVGKYPPTGKHILLQFYGYHKIKQERSEGAFSKRESIILVVHDIKQWWKKLESNLKL